VHFQVPINSLLENRQRLILCPSFHYETISFAIVPPESLNSMEQIWSPGIQYCKTAFWEILPPSRLAFSKRWGVRDQLELTYLSRNLKM